MQFVPAIAAALSAGVGVAGLIQSGENAGDMRKAQKDQAALQRVTQDRQLSTLQDQERRTSSSRRAPRGRRLLIAPESGEAGVAAKQSTLG